MIHKTIDIDQECEALQQFFQRIGDDAVVIQIHGRPVGIVYPANEALMTPRGRIEDARGGWDSLPEEITRAIEEGNS